MTSAAPAIVDAHVHFWDGARLSYPWLAEVPDIAGRHTPDELAVAAGTRAPGQLVFVEAGADERHAADEVAWIDELSARDSRITGIVAKVVVDRGAATTAALDDLVRHVRVRGVRHLIQGRPGRGYCVRPEFVAGVREVGARGWTFDLCVRHAQLRDSVELVRACPGTAFVLDHAGKPDIRGQLLDPWRADIADLARLPNVTCKLSGLVTEADPERWTVDDLRPYADHLLATFGPRRLMFGSDWPVVNLAADYTRWLDAALELLRPLSIADRAAVLSENTRRVYRLNQR